jgi:hypothetical protein
MVSQDNKGTSIPPSPWLTVQEAATYSRLSKPTLYKIFERGLVKTLSLREKGQIKGRRLVARASLEAFLESRSSGGQA